ncbi:class I SAM-dependent methyltransferase [Streptomyces sp. NPDC059452]|uniref:class I SAM-dependent methyltransferase n=1 Tax=Streptomyces sp. NPDC059452 TaxID=3346835 RepID=UPI003674C907
MRQVMVEGNARQRHLESLYLQERFDAKLAKIDEVESFDGLHGVETSVPVEPWDVQEASEATLINNSRYSPTPVQTIRQAIAESSVRYEEMSFVDFGSGKGWVMLVASDFPFRKIIGVEFSKELSVVARRNIENYRSDSRRSGPIEVHCLDARDFVIPDDASFFYFYEPFTAAVAEQVLLGIDHSIRRCPRKAVLCFVGRDLLPVIEGRPLWALRKTLKSPDDSYYDARLYVNTMEGESPGGCSS